PSSLFCFLSAVLASLAPRPSLPTRRSSDLIDALNMVRNRAGLPDRVTADQAQAREWLRHERQIEFFGEGDRWYTIRKWMIADDVIKDVHSMKITHLPDGGTRWFYDKSTTVDERAWDDRQYWLPVSRDEINKAPQLTQNPGY